MEFESPTQSWDEQKDAQRDNVPTYHGRRSATDLDLNLAATKDEADGDEYYSHDKEAFAHQIDMDIDGARQQIASPLTRNTSLVGSPSAFPTTRSMSPASKLSSSPIRKEHSYPEEGWAGSHVDGQRSSPERTPARRSASPSRQKTLPSPRRIPLKSPAGTQRSFSPGRTHLLRSPSPVRQTSASPGRTPLRSTPSARYRSPSAVRRISPSPGRIHPRSPSPVRQISPCSARQLSPSLERTNQRLPSPVRQISTSPRRIPLRSPSSARERSPSPRREGSPPASQYGSPMRYRSPPPRKYSSRSPSPERRSFAIRHRSPSRKYSPHDAQGRDSSPPVRHRSSSPRRRYSPQDIQRRRDRSLSRSPVRRRDIYGSSGRGYSNVSRSRSPLGRDHYRRSPRDRYSSRRRTPPREFWSRRRSPRRRPWSPPPNRSTGVGKPGNNLFVAGFSFVTTERDLEKKFSRFGRVTDVRIVRDKRSGDSRGFGFLSLERDEDADAAIRALDQTEWNGRIVLVEKSKTTAR